MDYNSITQKDDKAYAQTRWIDAIQNDFAVRADWCVKDFKDANHAPVVKPGQTISKGEIVNITVSVSDPDNNKVHMKYWQYFEADSYAGKITMDGSSFKVPADVKKGDTIHIICEATDDGTPSLTRYQRVIIMVK
jgi:hypothetical protein